MLSYSQWLYIPQSDSLCQGWRPSDDAMVQGWLSYGSGPGTHMASAPLVTILEQESLEHMQNPGDLPGHWAVSTASGT